MGEGTFPKMISVLQIQTRGYTDLTHDSNPGVMLAPFSAGAPPASHTCSILNVASRLATAISVPLIAICLPGQMLIGGESKLDELKS